MHLKAIMSRLRPWVIPLFLLTLIIILMNVIFPLEQGSPVDPINSFSFIAIVFIFSIMLKIDYTKPLLLFIMFIGIALVTIFSFSQGLVGILLLLFVLKMFRQL